MRPSVGRAGGFLFASCLAITAPLSEYVAIAAYALAVIGTSRLHDGTVFELLADPAERRAGRLSGLLEFVLAATLGAIATAVGILPIPIFVGATLLIGVGVLGAEIAREVRADRVAEAVGFITGGIGGYVIGHTLATGISIDVTTVGFLAVSGTLVAALGRSATWARHDGVNLLVAMAALAVFAQLPIPSIETLSLGIAITLLLAYLAMWIGAASVPGMVAGVLLVFLTLVLGGIEWFALLVTFFIIGGLATQFRYAEKRDRGVAEPNRGSRGSGNVLGNTAIALFAVLGYAAVPDQSGLWATVFLFAFAGSLATALADTLASEIGGLYDNPRLIVTFEAVKPGTDGAVTWQGELAGAAGAGLVALIFWALAVTDPLALVVVFLAGVLGMHVDSVLGAVFENRLIGNHAVNAAATFAGALLAGGVAFAGLV